MSKKRTRRFRPWTAVGCLAVVGALVAAGFLIAPRIREMLNPNTQPSWAGMPWYGPTQEYTVQRGSVYDGVSAYGVVSPARVARLRFRNASGEVTASMVSVGMMVNEGDVLVALDRAALERDVANARAALQDAQDALAELEAGMGGTSDPLRLEVELAAAQQAAADARAALDAYLAGGDTPQAQRATAAQELAAARARRDALLNDGSRQEQIDYLQWIYNQAEVKHGELALLPNPSEQDRDNEWLLRLDMEAKREALESAKLQYEMDKRAAEHAVAVAARTVTELDVQIAQGGADVERLKLEAALAGAEAKVASAQEAIAGLGESVPDARLAEARAKVLKAEGALQDAELALEDAVLVAPFSGTITEGEVVVGQRVSAGAVLVTIEDSASLGIVAQIPEIDIDKVREGADAVLTFDAFAGEPPRTGTVGEVPRYGTYANGVTTFAVPIEFDPSGIALLQGMTANIVIPLTSLDNVLVVPAAAVFNDGQVDFVMLLVGGQPERRTITKGASDGIYTEVVEGLSEGDVVSVPVMGPQGSGVPIYYGGM